MDRSELASLIRSELRLAANVGDDAAATDLLARRYYEGSLPGQPAPGRSTYVSTDIADMVEATVAASVPALMVEAVVEARPRGSEDVPQSRLETAAVHAVLFDLNDGGIALQGALRDALLRRHGWMRAWHETREEVRVRTFEGVTREEVSQAAASGAFAEDADIEWKDERCIVTETVELTRLRVMAVDPARLRWSANWQRATLDGIPFFAEHELASVSELIERGYPRTIVESLPDAKVEANELPLPAPVPSGNKAGRLVDTHRCYYRYDSDGDGIVELHRIVLGGETHILDDEIVGFIPYAQGVAILSPHSLPGVSLYDRLWPVQNAKTRAVRQWLDNAEKANNSRVAANRRLVDSDSLSNTRPWAPLLVDGPVEGNVRELGMVDVGPSMLGLCNYLDKTRSERGGAALDLQAAAAQIAGETAAGIERQYSVREQMATLFAVTMAETLLRNVYSLIHRAMREWIREPLTLELGGTFADVRPGEWLPREWRVKKGLSLADRSRKRLALESVITKQEALIQGGYNGVLTDPAKYYAAVTDWCFAAGLDVPSRYFTDPASPDAQQAADANAKAAKEQSMRQEAAVVQALRIEATKVAADAKAKQGELGHKYWQDVLDAEIEMAKLGLASVKEEQAIGLARSAQATRGAETPAPPAPRGGEA